MSRRRPGMALTWPWAVFLYLPYSFPLQMRQRLPGALYALKGGIYVVSTWLPALDRTQDLCCRLYIFPPSEQAEVCPCRAAARFLAWTVAATQIALPIRTPADKWFRRWARRPTPSRSALHGRPQRLPSPFKHTGTSADSAARLPPPIVDDAPTRPPRVPRVHPAEMTPTFPEDSEMFPERSS